ncbi:MAG: PIN domain-containing protein [Candidatus Nanoarchaeia archaeon]|jgi:predicted nucleic acid-binding protein
MQKKYYLDTCIWIDYFENRKDRFRPLGEWAFQLLRQITEEEDIVLFSRIVIKELKRVYNEQEIESIFSIIPKELLLEAEVFSKQIAEAEIRAKILGIPTNDVIHLIIARDNNAILVTRDKHLLFLDDIEIRMPEELL